MVTRTMYFIETLLAVNMCQLCSMILSALGFVEIKCPYAMRNMSPNEAAHTVGIVNSSENIQLKENHSYYAQIQGQMALGERPWCDFVIYTQKDISIQRITFNQSYWSLTKVVSFYDNCIAPECVSMLEN